MKISDKLLNIYQKYEEDLDYYPWTFETERWKEFIFCIFERFLETPDQARELADGLESLGLIDPEVLSSPSNEQMTVLKYTLKNAGLGDTDSNKISMFLVGVAKNISSNYAGKPQHILRKYGELMRNDLVKEFADDNVNKDDLRYAITHWLQNVLGLPISLEHKALKDYCTKNKITLKDLWKAADDVDMNVVVVDDLLVYAASNSRLSENSK
jgi:hypothetical protein